MRVRDFGGEFDREQRVVVHVLITEADLQSANGGTEHRPMENLVMEGTKAKSNPRRNIFDA